MNELNYITIMKSVNFQIDSYTLSQKHFFNNLIDNYIGYGLVTQKYNKYVIDTRYLQQFEIRDGYSNLNCVIYLNDKMHFDYCKIDGKKRTDDFAIRECVTAILSIITVEKHLYQVHLLISDNFNLLLNEIEKTNPIYRLLIPITHNPYNVNEIASIALLGQTGVCNWFNFTRNGLEQYYEYTKQNFKIRDFLIPKELPGESINHKHQHMWYNCIHNFVNDFLSNQSQLNCNYFISLITVQYDGIYDETKTKLENIIDICTMMIYLNIIHECYSNSKLSKLFMNPYTISTSWKYNDSQNLGDKINYLSEQTSVNFVSYATSLEAIRIVDDRWINMCCVNETEKIIYTNFIKDVLNLNIPNDAILHPNNISSSISY
jgi:hypothetical protein